MIKFPAILITALALSICSALAQHGTKGDHAQQQLSGTLPGAAAPGPTPRPSAPGLVTTEYYGR